MVTLAPRACPPVGSGTWLPAPYSFIPCASGAPCSRGRRDWEGVGTTQQPPEYFPVFFFSLSGFEDSGFCAFEFCSSSRGLCDLGPWQRVSGPASPPWHGRSCQSLAGRPVERMERAITCGELRAGCTVLGTRDTRWLLPIPLSRRPASRFQPGGLGDPAPGHPGSPSCSRKLPKPAPAHSAILSGWHPTRREREASPRPRHQMGTIWAGGSGRAGSCRSGRAWQPLPRPGLAPRPPAPQVSQAARGGRGGLAGLQGWAGGFPLWAPVPPGSLPNARQVEECRARPLLASPPPSLGSHAAGLAAPHSPWTPSCSVSQAPGRAGLWAFALAALPTPSTQPRACRTHADPSVAPLSPSGLILKAISLGPPSVLTPQSGASPSLPLSTLCPCFVFLPLFLVTELQIVGFRVPHSAAPSLPPRRR